MERFILESYENDLEKLGMERGTYYVSPQCVDYPEIDESEILFSNILYTLYRVESYYVLTLNSDHAPRLIVPRGVNHNEHHKGYKKYIESITKKIIVIRFINGGFERVSSTKRSEYKPNVNDMYNKWTKRLDIFKSMNKSVRSLNIVFYGKPGTGKTTFVEDLAYYMNYDIFIYNIDDIKSTGRIGNKFILVIEELDKLLNPDGSFCDGDKGNSHLLLQLLDGFLRPKNCIVVITCNDIGRLKKNKVLSRDGRVNFIEEFGSITKLDFYNVVAKYYSDGYDELWNKLKGYNMTIAQLSTLLKTSVLNAVPISEIVYEPEDERDCYGMYH